MDRRTCLCVRAFCGVRVYMHVCSMGSVCACMCACACVCMFCGECVRACVCVFCGERALIDPDALCLFYLFSLECCSFWNFDFPIIYIFLFLLSCVTHQTKNCTTLQITVDLVYIDFYSCFMGIKYIEEKKMHSLFSLAVVYTIAVRKTLTVSKC